MLLNLKQERRGSLDDYCLWRKCLGGMFPRICICCGEPMASGRNALSRNPNICASCSSILDGMEEPEDLEAEKASVEQQSSHVERFEATHKAA